MIGWMDGYKSMFFESLIKFIIFILIWENKVNTTMLIMRNKLIRSTTNMLNIKLAIHSLTKRKF
jgi:hypothetical protein